MVKRYAEYIMGYRSFGVDIMFTLFTPTPFSRGVGESVGVHRAAVVDYERTAVRVVLASLRAGGLLCCCAVC